MLDKEAVETLESFVNFSFENECNRTSYEAALTVLFRHKRAIRRLLITLAPSGTGMTKKEEAEETSVRS